MIASAIIICKKHWSFKNFAKFVHMEELNISLKFYSLMKDHVFQREVSFYIVRSNAAQWSTRQVQHKLKNGIHPLF